MKSKFTLTREAGGISTALLTLSQDVKKHSFKAVLKGQSLACGFAPSLRLRLCKSMNVCVWCELLCAHSYVLTCVLQQCTGEDHIFHSLYSITHLLLHNHYVNILIWSFLAYPCYFFIAELNDSAAMSPADRMRALNLKLISLGKLYAGTPRYFPLGII